MSEALRQEWWYDDDRQALMVGSWPYGRRATFDDIAPLRAALTQALAERDGLREALEQLLMAEGKTLSCGLVHPEFDVHHPEGHPNPTRIFIEAVLTTAPNTKDGGEGC